MPTFVQILDFIGTFAFAISGIRLASAKRFDWFGAYVVGLATAIGGGTIRDVLLDDSPGRDAPPLSCFSTRVFVCRLLLSLAPPPPQHSFLHLPPHPRGGAGRREVGKALLWGILLGGDYHG